MSSAYGGEFGFPSTINRGVPAKQFFMGKLLKIIMHKNVTNIFVWSLKPSPLGRHFWHPGNPLSKRIFMMIILCVSLFSFVSPVSAEWFYNSENVLTNINIYSDFDVVKTGPGGYVKNAIVNLTFFPKKTEYQEVFEFKMDPIGYVDDESLRFEWEIPSGNIGFNVNSNIRTTNQIKEVSKKIDFPIKELAKGLVVYTKPSKTIDSDNEGIIRVASDLAKGEDDLYIVVFKMSEWVKNSIKYNLSTLTAEVSQKSSWVLENKQGVCDELTSLFIALLRSVGIPSRFVGGIAYTESELFPEKWGPHGWAEVYFPDIGWVPFDVTYGEFGWIDPTHIKFKDSIDPDEPSTYYQWEGKYSSLNTKELNIKTRLILAQGYKRIPLKIEVISLKKVTGLDSYNLIEADIENPNGFYYATELNLIKPREITIVGDISKSLLLLPKEKKKVYWILKLDNSKLDDNYIYTFPIIVGTLNNITSATSFTANTKEEDISFEEIKQHAKLLEEEGRKKYSTNVFLDCKAEANEFFVYEDFKVYCDIKNIGNTFLEGIDVCFEGKCKKTDLGISQTTSIVFDINKSKVGFRQSPVTLRNDLISKTVYIELKVKDPSKIEIEELAFPINLSYDDNFTVNFSLLKKSYSEPQRIDVRLEMNGIEKKWYFKELKEDRRFSVTLQGNNFDYGKNDYKIIVNFNDETGTKLKKKYTASKNFSINVYGVNPVEKSFLLINSLFNLDIEVFVFMFLISSTVFVVVVTYLFRKKKNFK